jgi:hypothetical protein
MAQPRPALFDCAGALALASVIASLPFAAAIAQSLGAPPVGVTGLPYTVVGSGQRFARLQEAVNAIGNGAGTIRIAPGRWQDCAVQAGGVISFVAAVPGKAMLDGMLCEGKAGLVLRGRGAKVEGLVFGGYRSPDGNGAGIRLERGNLTVSQAWFRDSDEGILGDNDPAAAVVIDKSTFSHLGRCDRGLACAHSVYIGDYGSVTVTRSRFEAGDGGHYLKARSGRVSITANAFDDTAGTGTNYMIDLPAGASGRIADNWFVQGQDKDNSRVFIGVGAESRNHSAAGLTVEHNVARFAPGVWRVSAFVADWTGEDIAIAANTLDGGILRYMRRF